jgi:hypothetical protein
MITTVTTTTTTTMTTTTTTMLATTTTTTATATAVGIAHAAVFGAIGVVILIMLLIAKELLSAYGEECEGASERAEEAEGIFVDSHSKAKMLAKTLSAAIYPLLFSFTLIVIVKIMEVL